MSAEENKAIVRREVEGLYNPDENLDAVYEIFTPNYILHGPQGEGGKLLPPLLH